MIVTFFTTSKAKTPRLTRFFTLQHHGEDDLVQLKDRQSDRCWVDVPTQAAPDLRPARALELVAQLARQPLHLLDHRDGCVLEGDEPFTNTSSLSRCSLLSHIYLNILSDFYGIHCRMFGASHSFGSHHTTHSFPSDLFQPF